MSKDLTPAQIADALASMGLKVPAELKAKVTNAKSDAAEIEILSHLKSDEVKAAEAWRETIFDLAARVGSEFNGQEKNVGQGKVFEQYVEVELPDGSKFALRRREPRTK